MIKILKAIGDILYFLLSDEEEPLAPDVDVNDPYASDFGNPVYDSRMTVLSKVKPGHELDHPAFPPNM